MSSDTKISAFSAATALGGTEALPGVQTGANVKITASQILTYVLGDATTTEKVQDVVGAFASGATGGGITVSYDDPGNALTVGRAAVDGLTTAATAVANADSVEIAQGSAVKRATFTMVRDWLQPTFAGSAGGGTTLTISAGTATYTRAPVDGLTTAATSIAAADSVEIAQSSAVKRATWAMARDYLHTTVAGAGGATVAAAAGVLTVTTLKHGSHASSAPGATTEDTAHGYSVGSTWVVTNLADRYVCRDPTTNNAIWTKEDAADHGGYVTLRWYPSIRGSVAAGGTITASTVRLVPFMVKQRVTITDMGALVTTTSGGGNFELAIYADAAATRRPTGTPLNYTTKTLSTASGAFVSSVLQAGGGTQILEPGVIYWQALACDNSTAVFQVLATAVNDAAFLIGSTTPANMAIASTSGGYCLSAPHTFANDLSSLDLTSASFTENTAQQRAGLMYFKVQ